jgi:hypothetical protein
MRSKPLSLHDQGLAALFANQNERHQSVGLIDVEQHTILTKQPLRRPISTSMLGFTATSRWKSAGF